MTEERPKKGELKRRWLGKWSQNKTRISLADLVNDPLELNDLARDPK